MTSLLAAIVVLGLVVALLLGLRAVVAFVRDRRSGRLLAVDDGVGLPLLRAPRYRLVGRPDELRALPNGVVIPVEIKSRRSPRTGPPPSHRVQVEAYCFLLEETTGRSPPYGLLRYADGEEWKVPWDRPARGEVLDALDAVRRPYRGEATPSVARCVHCGWRTGCDARAA
jgi:CRISPR-associated exonuclease Cas4